MADASYVIEVASSFKGEQTIEQMDQLTSKLVGAGAGANDFQSAVVALSQKIAAASDITTTANKALAAGNAEYKLLEQAALQAAKAVEKAAAGSKGVVDLGAYRSAVVASNQATSALEEHARTLTKLEQAAKHAKGGEDELSNSLLNVKKLGAAVASDQSKAAAASDRNLKKLKAGLAGMGGPLGSLGAAGASAVDDFRDLEEAVGSTGAKLLTVGAGVATAGAAIAALTLIVAAATIAIAAWAIGLADSNRNTKLAQEAAEAMHPELVGLRDTFAALTAETGIHSDELASYAGQLKEAKVAAEDIPDALRAIALSEAALGKGGSKDFLDDIKKSKVAVSTLSAEVNSKLGGIVKKQMIGLSAQSQKFHDEIGNLFGGLNIEPVLLGLQKLVGLFDENTAAGEAIKFLFESVFQPLIDNATTAATVVEAFVLGFLIGLTKLYIAVKPAMKAVAEFLGFNSPGLTDTLAAVTKAGEYLVPAFLVVVGIFAALAVAVGVAVAAVVGIQLAIYSMAAAVVYAGVKIVEGVIGAWNSVTAYLDSLSLSGVGTALMQGLANGIAAAAGLPLEAISAVAKGVITSAKSVLGIHSPSTELYNVGDNTVAGYVNAVDDGAPEAQAAVEEMAAPPSALSAQDALSGNAGGSAPVVSAASSAPASGGAAGGGPVFHFEGAHLVFEGVKDGPESIDRFKEMLMKVYEGEAMSSGGASAEAAA